MKIAALVAVIALGVAAWRSGVLSLFADPERMRDLLLTQGTLGYLVFVLAFVVLQALGIPMMAFVVGASYVWPKPIAFGLSVAGIVGSSCLGFGFARFVAREWIASRLPPKLRGVDQKVGERAFSTIFVMRLIFWGNPFVHALFGISKVRFSDYLFASVAAYVPIIAAAVWASGYAIDLIKGRPVTEWLPYAAGLVLLAGGLRLYRARAKRRKDEQNETAA
jgi:uncharacterized membrane protein YdjX (TVP38/TMEM64 family)